MGVRLEPAPLRADIARLAGGTHRDPFAVLGLHQAEDGDGCVVRVFRPDVAAATLAWGTIRTPMQALAPGFFTARLPRALPYRLELATAAGPREEDDPYRFGLAISPEEAAALKAGRCWRAHQVLGAHAALLEGVAGVRFAAWAPNARRVSVVGDWNGWNPLLAPMRYRHEMGAWEIFLPGLEAGCAYAFDVLPAKGRPVRRRDPYARALEPAVPGAARCTAPLEQVPPTPPAEEGGRAILAAPAAGLGEAAARARLFEEAARLGCSHLLLQAPQECAPDPVLGPLPLAPFAPAAALGGEAGLLALVREARARGLKLLADWPLAAFPAAPQGFACFDGGALYEPGEARRALSPSPAARRFDFARWEGANLLLCGPLRWLCELGLDGLYLRGLQEALRPAYAGGAEVDAAAVEFLRNLSELVAEFAPHALLLGEAAPGWPGATRPTQQGGLGLLAVRRPEWAGLLHPCGARLAALLAFDLADGVRAFADCPSPLGLLLGWTLPGWTLLEQSALRQSETLAPLLARLQALRRCEPALAPAARLRLLAQPGGAGGVLALARRGETGAQALLLAAPGAPFAGRAPAPAGGRFQVAARVGGAPEGAWLEAEPDPGAPSDFSLNVALPAGAGLLLLGPLP